MLHPSMQRCVAYRLTREPRRLWRRYLRYNPRFVGAFALQLTKTLRRTER